MVGKLHPLDEMGRGKSMKHPQPWWKVPGQVVRSTALVRKHDERMSERNKNRAKLWGKGVGWRAELATDFSPF